MWIFLLYFTTFAFNKSVTDMWHSKFMVKYSVIRETTPFIPKPIVDFKWQKTPLLSRHLHWFSSMWLKHKDTVYGTSNGSNTVYITLIVVLQPCTFVDDRNGEWYENVRSDNIIITFVFGDKLLFLNSHTDRGCKASCLLWKHVY